MNIQSLISWSRAQVEADRWVPIGSLNHPTQSNFRCPIGIRSSETDNTQCFPMRDPIEANSRIR